MCSPKIVLQRSLRGPLLFTPFPGDLSLLVTTKGLESVCYSPFSPFPFFFFVSQPHYLSISPFLHVFPFNFEPLHFLSYKVFLLLSPLYCNTGHPCQTNIVMSLETLYFFFISHFFLPFPCVVQRLPALSFLFFPLMEYNL